MALVARITSIHSTLFKIAKYCAFAGGCYGLYDSIRYARENYNQNNKFHLIENCMKTTGGSMILGFATGYGSPIIIPMLVYEFIN